MNKLMEAFGEIAKLSPEAERALLNTIGCDCTSKGNIKPLRGLGDIPMVILSCTQGYSH